MANLIPTDEWSSHANPDGSMGGQVFKGASVDATAIIGATAVVLPGAIVGAGQVVKNGTVVTASGAQVRFGKTPKPN